MPRRKTSPLEDLTDTIVQLPPNAGLALIAVIFVTMRWALPFILTSPTPDAKTSLAKSIGTLSHDFAPLFAAMLLLIWCIGLVNRLLDREQLDAQTGIDSIRELSWQKFESLLAEYYKRLGYAVEHTGNDGPDGGIDLKLTRDGKTVLVQCKQWRRDDVGVEKIRELRGVVAARRADRGVFVTSGRFTTPALNEFRDDPAIELIDGEALEPMIREAQRAAGATPAKPTPPVTPATTPTPVTPATAPHCPICNSNMVARVARRGPNPGSRFWGCPRYPDCRGKRDLTR